MPSTLHGVVYCPGIIASIVLLMSLAITLSGILATIIMLNILHNVLSTAEISFNSTTPSSFSEISSLLAKELGSFKRKHSGASY